MSRPSARWSERTRQTVANTCRQVHLHSSHFYNAARPLASNTLVIKYSWTAMVHTVPSAHLHIQSVTTNHCMPCDPETGMGRYSATDLISNAHISSSPITDISTLPPLSQRPSNLYVILPCMLSGFLHLIFHHLKFLSVLDVVIC